MANPNKVSGLTPVKYLNGADWDGKGNMYCFLASGDANVISVGDPVGLGGSADVNGIPSIIQATAGATAVGVVVAVGTNARGGPYINPSDLTVTQAPATKSVAYYALVVDDPNVIFEIQEGLSTGTALVVGNVGENADWVAAAAATGTRVSGFYLDNAAHDTTSTRNMKILRLAQRVDNALGAYAKWHVLINNHAYRTGVAGI